MFSVFYGLRFGRLIDYNHYYYFRYIEIEETPSYYDYEYLFTKFVYLLNYVGCPYWIFIYICSFLFVIFNKPFVVVGNESRGMSRFLSLLKQFGQEKRLVSSVDELSDDIVNQTLGDIDSIFNDLRSTNINYLPNA